MRCTIVVVLLLLTSAVHSDLNRTTGLIDIPIAEVLPHGEMRGGGSISFSEGSPNREENFNFSLGLFDRAEVSIGVLSRKAVEMNLLCKLLEEETRWPAVAFGIWDIASEEYVSDPGFGSDAYEDELAYGSDRPRELLSGFFVVSKSIIPFARLHMGLGRGRFVGWGPRSINLKLGNQPNSAVGLFLGFDATIKHGLQLLGELDGRDVNFGIRYSKKWIEVNLAMTKLEHFILSSSQHSPRFVVGTSVHFPLLKRPTQKPLGERAHPMGDLSGTVLDAENWEPVEASVKVLGTGILKYTDLDNGNFAMKDVTPGHYVVEVNAPGYKSKLFTISLEPGKTTRQNFFLDPQKVEREVILEEHVYFESGQVEFTADSKVVLERVAKILKENPEIEVEIKGYTDSVGSDEFNLILSRNRAGVVKAYLVRLYGIDPDRFEYEGYGSADPIGDNSTRTGRALNRRVEFKVVE